MQKRFTELTDSQWQCIEKILEKEQGETKRRHELRRIMNAILWITRTGEIWTANILAGVLFFTILTKGERW